LAFGVLSAGALSLPPLSAVQRLDRLFFDAWTRLSAPVPSADILVLEAATPAALDALIETARWQDARLLVSTLEDRPAYVPDDLAVLGPVAIASPTMPILRETGWADGGYLWPRNDVDGVVRFARPVLGDFAETASLSLAAARHLAAAESLALKSTQMGSTPRLRTDGDGRRWLRFFAPDGLRAVALETVRLKADALTGKVVVVGATGGARHATPVGSLSTAELVAHTLAGYLEDLVVATGPWFELTGWLIAASWMGLIALLKPAGSSAVLLTAASVATTIGAGAVAFIQANAWIAVAGPLVALLPLGALSLRISQTAALAGAADRKSQTLLDGRRLVARGQLVEAWAIYRHLPLSTELLGEAYALGRALADQGEQRLAADAFHRIAQADASYKDVVSRLVAAAQRPGPPKPGRPKPASLGRYEVLGVIGTGAMGVVYLGRDPSINRIVAIKAIYLEQEFEASFVPEARERFTREVEIAGRLSHPAIVTIYDTGEENGIAYVAMEYLRGVHLSDHAEPKTLLPIADVLDLMARAADALDFAHQQNVVHRDIKPANIMYDSATDSLKITDFGVARLMDVSRTRTGIILGTPSYMSPEQLQGENVNGHTDLFALGVSVYQLLTGYLPFQGNSMTELMFVIANEPHIPVTAIREELPSVLDAVVDRALAKNPADRYGDGAEMAAALRAALAEL
jgi:serine/threonine-protein kinase